MAAPGAWHSGPRPQRKEPGTYSLSLPSHMGLEPEPEREPLTLKAHVTSCRWHVEASFTQSPTQAQPILGVGKLTLM